MIWSFDQFAIGELHKKGSECFLFLILFDVCGIIDMLLLLRT